MKYLLHLNHPQGEKVYKVNKRKESRARKYFSTVDLIESEISIRGVKYKALIDWEMLTKYSNFDCFNCQDSCCGGNPTKYEGVTREYLLNNLERYNQLTKNNDILYELGLEESEIIENIKNSDLMVPEEFAEDEIFQCTCCFKSDNQTTLCSIHAIALENGESFQRVVDLKPLLCTLWPLEILVEDDMSQCYITLPDDFTNDFTCENYYKIGCINYSFSQSPQFRRFNPEGFLEDDFEPFYIAYKESLIYGLGEKFYKNLIEKIEESEI